MIWFSSSFTSKILSVDLIERLGSSFLSLSIKFSSVFEFVLEGVKTTIPFHKKLMNHEMFKEGKYTTKFMEEYKL